MVTLSYPLLGIVCLLAGLGITFFWPLGQARRGHLLSEVMILALFVAAGGFLWAGGLIPESVSWVASMVIGGIVGLAAVVLRDVRRWTRHFQNKVYRWNHPYYWYGRVGRAVSGGERRRRR